MPARGELHELQVLATQLAERQQADILLYSGALTGQADGSLTLEYQDRTRTKRPTCLLMLRSLGGSVETAYRLARALRRRYLRVLVYADDYCRGAGMLLALAADELVISDFGELGPLNLVSPDDALQAARMDRATKTAAHYIQRLGADHLKVGALERLLTGYPSPDYIIDREEAAELLRTVRAPTPQEDEFLTQLEPVLTERHLQGRLLFMGEALSLAHPPMCAPAPSEDVVDVAITIRRPAMQTETHAMPLPDA